MNDYKPNSNRFKEEKQGVPAAGEKRVSKVIKSSAKVQKKSEISKFADVFIAEDVNNVKNYILMDVLVPATKKAISDIITNGIDMLLWGKSGGGRSTSSGNRISYSGFFNQRDRESQNYSAPRTSGFDFENISFTNRGDAEAVRIQMEEVIDRYGFVTVADLYDMVELSAPFTGNKYGWTNLNSAEVIRGRDGYYIKLPKTKPLDTR